MSKTHCKEGCDFLHNSLGEKPKCLIYDKKVKIDDDGYVRLKRCVRESREYKVKCQIEDIKTFYDAFVCEMDMMFSNLNKLIKGDEEK